MPSLEKNVKTPTPTPTKDGDGGKDAAVYLLWLYARKENVPAAFHVGLFYGESKAREAVGEVLSGLSERGWSVDSGDIHISRMQLNGFFVLPSGV